MGEKQQTFYTWKDDSASNSRRREIRSTAGEDGNTASYIKDLANFHTIKPRPFRNIGGGGSVKEIRSYKESLDCLASQDRFFSLVFRSFIILLFLYFLND